jgi:uncharacterized protein
VVLLIIAATVLSICLILLGLTGDFLVDWLWFSTIGYLGVFWTTIAAEGEVFFAVFVATAIILWVNGSTSTRLGALSENEEAVRDLRRTVFSSQCQPIAGPLKQTFYCLIPTGERKP